MLAADRDAEGPAGVGARQDGREQVPLLGKLDEALQVVLGGELGLTREHAGAAEVEQPRAVGNGREELVRGLHEDVEEAGGDDVAGRGRIPQALRQRRADLTQRLTRQTLVENRRHDLQGLRRDLSADLDVDRAGLPARQVQDEHELARGERRELQSVQHRFR